MKKILLFIPFIFLFAACSQDNEIIAENDDSTNFPKEQKETDGMMVLGEKLENPYSIANMEKAYADLIKTRAAGDFKIETTDLYVRFLPKDSTELLELQKDTLLELFDYPLDYDIEVEGTYYHDPSIPEGQITWLYTTVKPDYEFPAIQYEILEKCFIPNEDDLDDEWIDDGIDDSVETRAGDMSFAELLEQKAFENAGLIKKFESKFNEPETRSWKRKRPTGTLKVYDTYLRRDVPVKGVKVRCHTVVKWSTAFTDENGYYSMGSKFRIGPHYAVVFDNSQGFTIWGNWGPFAAANYNMGWHSKGGHDRTFGTNAKAWDWCSVNNAGFEYYQNAKKDGIGLPPHNPRIWVFRHQSNASCAPRLRRVWHPIGYSSNSGWSNFFINITAGRLLTYTNTLLKFALPDIVIGTGGGYNTYDIYESVNHELSHASHFNKVGSAFWAKYVNYIITYGKKYDHPYGDASCNNSGFCGVGEMWGYAMGYIRTYEKYQQKPKNGQSKWFQPNLLYDLMTEKILTKKPIFDCLSSDVTSHALLKQKMISRYPSKKDSIIAKFSRYGF